MARQTTNCTEQGGPGGAAISRRRIMKRIALLTIGAALLVLALPALGANGPKGPGLFETLVKINGASTGAFSHLIGYLEDAGLDQVLDDRNGQLTLFAPTNSAFLSLPDEVLEALANDPDYLRDVLRYHLTKGRRDYAEVIGFDQMRMLNGQFLDVEYAAPDVFLIDSDPLSPDAGLIIEDIGAANGIIHVIDEVLIP
jgi:uncharacterized surface protein with fasciclin (FAS1) repeats